MVQPTPWQARKEQPAQRNTSRRAKRGALPRRNHFAGPALSLRPHLAWIASNSGYLCAATSSLITLFALFQPWINASATDGTITATPFGKFEISSSLVALWSGSPPPAAKINGMWASLACVAVLVTVAVVAVNFRTCTQAMANVVVISSVATSLLVAFALIHMNRQAPSIRNMVGNGPARDPGSVAGLVIRWASGNSSYALPGVRRYTWSTAGLTTWAWLAGAMAMFSAAAAIGQWARNRRTGRDPQAVRVSLVKSRP